jgi:hypothetical protein
MDDGDHFVSFDSDPKQFSKFTHIVHRSDKQHGLDAAMVTCSSMLLAVFSYMSASLGPAEAHRALDAALQEYKKRTQT